MRWAWLAVAVVALLMAFWAVGELHRRSCIQEHHVGCTIWPWNSGHVNAAAGWGKP
jgi:hypothetical protein